MQAIEQARMHAEVLLVEDSPGDIRLTKVRLPQQKQS
jgi:hypothetical protein